MPKGINNWSFNDIVEFLERHFFICVNTEGSHYYFRGLVDGEERLTFIDKHSKSSVPPLTMDAIIFKSGIPKKVWKQWAKAGNKKARKRILYNGAKKWR